MGNAESLPLSDGVAVGAVMTSQKLASAVHDIPGQKIRAMLFFQKPDIIVVRDEADLLALPLLGDLQAEPRRQSRGPRLLVSPPSGNRIRASCSWLRVKRK